MCPSFLLLCPSLTSPLCLISDIQHHQTQNLPLSISLLIPSFKGLSSFISFLLWFCNYTSCVHLMNRTPPNPNPFEDPKVRLRHHSLMQDYQELHMVRTLFFFPLEFKSSFSLWVWSILSLDLKMFLKICFFSFLFTLIWIKFLFQRER